MALFPIWVLYNEDEHIYQIHKEGNVKQNQNEITERKLQEHKKIEIQDKKYQENYKRDFNYKRFSELYHMNLREKIMVLIFIVITLFFATIFFITDIIYFFNTGF